MFSQSVSVFGETPRRRAEGMFSSVSQFFHRNYGMQRGGAFQSVFNRNYGMQRGGAFQSNSDSNYGIQRGGAFQSVIDRNYGMQRGRAFQSVFDRILRHSPQLLAETISTARSP